MMSTEALGRALALAALLAAARGSVDVMKDVTLGFGEALAHCRESVRTLSQYPIRCFWLYTLLKVNFL